MAEVAFFGLGTMGLPIALNLLRAGHKLHATPYRGIMEGPLEAEKHGAMIHDNLAEMVSNADFVISVVPNDDSIRELYLDGEMKKHIKEGAIIIDMTSSSPEIIREVEDFYRDKGVKVIDAPMTGALPKAIDGTLIIMGAGDPEAFEKSKEIFAPIAEKVFQLGKVGDGKLIKAMTNLLGAVNLAAIGEFYRFARAMGLDMESLAQVVELSAGGSTQFTRNFGKIVAQDFKPLFRLDLMRKDMGIAMDCAGKCPNLYLPLFEHAYALFQQASEYDQCDMTAIARVNGGI